MCPTLIFKKEKGLCDGAGARGRLELRVNVASVTYFSPGLRVNVASVTYFSPGLRVNVASVTYFSPKLRVNVASVTYYGERRVNSPKRRGRREGSGLKLKMLQME
jgi:hypothetical protein